MASTSTKRVPSYSSSSTSQPAYDVFLNFHVEDTHKNFTDQLYIALREKGINVFEDKSEQGQFILEEFFEGTQKSQWAVVVFSENYAFSKQCLTRFTQIIDCKRKRGRRLIVLPIFYQVDPFSVRCQRESFAEAFAKHGEDPTIDEKHIRSWRDALSELSSLTGYYINHSSPNSDAKLIEQITREILRLRSIDLKIPKNLIGLESKVEILMKLICVELGDVRFIGIVGMSGIGKTALAEVIYEKLAFNFEASCFIASVGKQARKHGLASLQYQLLSTIVGRSEVNTSDPYMLAKIPKKKVFVVLDDIEKDEEINALAGNRNWFGSGSRIIVTGRDFHILKRSMDETYEIEELADNDALQLFSLKAFGKNSPPEAYIELSKDIVNHAGGLPLFLEVYGSFLRDRSLDTWKSTRDLLKVNLDSQILARLQSTYDGLSDLQKGLFLDIACFFVGQHLKNITHKLKSFGYFPEIDIEVLKDKSLIKITKDGQLLMHDLLQKMGQKIVNCESPCEPGKRNRLWYYEDIIHVLKCNTGTNAIEGIALIFPSQEAETFSLQAFSKLTRLRMLIIKGEHSISGFYDANKLHTQEWRKDSSKFELHKLLNNLKWHGSFSKFQLSNNLCVLEWWEYPFKSLPISFCSNNLVELIMPFSHIECLWKGKKVLNKLKLLDLSYSQGLVETPDLSGVPNLKELKLFGCSSLSKIHPSIGSLKQLRILILGGCISLKRLPDVTGLAHLELLDLSGCSEVKKLPSSFGNLSLQYIDVSKRSSSEKISEDLEERKVRLFLERKKGDKETSVSVPTPKKNEGRETPALLPPGFIFRPTDEQLVSYYLKMKNEGRHSEVQIIPEVDFFNCDPGDLPELPGIKSDDSRWFFFCRRDALSRSSSIAASGYWKTDDFCSPIKSSSGDLVGKKMTSAFYMGLAPKAERTEWMMHEYHATEDGSARQDAFILGVLIKKELSGDGDIGVVTFDLDALLPLPKASFDDPERQVLTGEELPQQSEYLHETSGKETIEKQMTLESLGKLVEIEAFDVKLKSSESIEEVGVKIVEADEEFEEEEVEEEEEEVGVEIWEEVEGEEEEEEEEGEEVGVEIFEEEVVESQAFWQNKKPKIEVELESQAFRQDEKPEIEEVEAGPITSNMGIEFYSNTIIQREVLSNIMQGGLKLEKPPKDDLWEKAKEIYLMDNELSTLPENPRCPILLTLLLQRNYTLRTIPPSFFDNMPTLQTLNLSQTSIRSLPNSIINLVRLKRLFINDCYRFMELSPKVGALKQLEVLDLEGTDIIKIPEEIKELTNLTCLKLSLYSYPNDTGSDMQSGTMVHYDVISALSRLDELSINVNSNDQWWITCAESIVSAVCSLKNLDNLELYFPRVTLVSQFLSNSQTWRSSSLSHFRFIVGCHLNRIFSRLPRDVEFELQRWERCLKYINGEDVPKDIEKVLRCSTAFFLERHVTITKLSDFGIGNMRKLKCCVMGVCNKVEDIIDESDTRKEDSEVDAFEEEIEVEARIEDASNRIVPKTHGDKELVLGSLEYLYIYYMMNLRNIWKGSVQPKCLSLLKTLTLRICPKLNTIFTEGLLGNLYNLEELTVEDCPLVKSLVSGEILANNNAYFLPNLKRISLHDMPALVRISRGLLIVPRLELMSFYTCPQLKSLSIEEKSGNNLRKIKGERSWWEALEWRSGRPAYLDDVFVPIY